MDDLIKVIKQQLKQKGLTANKLAKDLGYSSVYLYDLLKGRRRFNETITNKICTALQIQIEYKITKESEELVNE